MARGGCPNFSIVTTSVSKGVLRQLLAALCASLCSFSASAAFNWIAPLLVRLKSPDGEIPLSPDESSWVVSIILLGNTIVTIPVAFFVDKLGRKPLLLATGPILISSWTIILTTRSVGMLYVVRLIQGFGMGVVYVVLPLYLAEIAVPSVRANMTYFFPGVWYMGSLYEYAAGPLTSYQTLAWISMAPPIIFLLTFVWFPESPYFLLMKGKDKEAADSLSWLRGDVTLDALDKELVAMKESVEEERRNKGNWRDVLGTRVGRKSFGIVTCVAASYIMCGGTAMFSYATYMFNELPYGGIPADGYTFLMGVAVLLMVPFSGMLADRTGRRVVLLVSSIGATICLSLTSSFTYLMAFTSLDISSWTWLPYFTIILYTILIGTGVEAIVPVLQAELFANSTRGVASSLSFSLQTIMSFFCLKMFQVVADGVGLYCIYGLFAICAALGAIYIYICVPETKGKTFAEIQLMLSIETKTETTEL